MVVAAGQANLEDGSPPLQGTQADDEALELPLFTGSITRDAGGTYLSPTIHPITGSNTANVTNRMVNIVMWNFGSWFPIYQNTAAC